MVVPLTLVDYYSNDSRDNALLRYSLWIAEGKICYICDKKLSSVRDVQIDHVLPKSEKRLSATEFDRMWKTCAPKTLPNLGRHHISNLRAACGPCNSSHRKGSKVLRDRFVISVLADSVATIAKAHKEQRKLLKNDAMGESLVHLTTASTENEYSVLRDEDLKHALLDTMFEASRGQGGGSQKRDLWSSQLMTQVTTSAEMLRLLAALHLVSGVSSDALVQGFVSEAAAAIQEKFDPLVRATYQDLRGPNVGAIDWAQTLFEVSMDKVAIDGDDWSCQATITVGATVSAPVQVQSDDGSSLEEDQSADCDIEGEIYLSASLGMRGYEVETVWEAFDLTLSV